MTHRRTAAQWIAMAGPLLSVLAVQGCTRESKTIEERPAEFTAPKAGESRDLDAFRAELAGFSRGPLHTHSRRVMCPGTVECHSPVTIQAIGLSKDIEPDSGPPLSRIIGQIRNLDTLYATEMDSLKPSSQAEYYVYIDRNSGGKARWNLLEVPNAPKGIIRTIVQDAVRNCHDRGTHPPWPSSDVDFANCGDKYPGSVNKSGLFSGDGVASLLSKFAARFRPLPAVAQPGKWYGCPDGCCT